MRKSSGESAIAPTLRGEAERFAQVGGDRIGGGFELVAGVAAGGDAVHAQREVAVVVVLERDRASVVVPAVGLDREPLVGEEEVDAVPVDAVVDERRGRPWCSQRARKSSSRSERVRLIARQVRHAVPGELRLAQGAAEEVGLDGAGCLRVVRRGS